MKEIQDSKGVVRFAGDVKRWPPTVEEARPARCARCGVGAREGGCLWLHGHGLVERQQRGPPTPDGEPTCGVLWIRRFLCLKCETVLRVVPASCAPRKHFSAAAIAQALALWGLCGLCAAEVRERVNDWRTRGASARGWRSLTRWAGDAAAGRLFRTLIVDGTRSAREAAKQAAQTICGHAPIEWRGAALDHQAHAGAGHVS